MEESKSQEIKQITEEDILEWLYEMRHDVNFDKLFIPDVYYEMYPDEKANK